jgi:hypothetical protein
MDEPTGDPAGTALAEAARDADLVLVGVPHGDRSRTMLAQLLAEASAFLAQLGAVDRGLGAALHA